MPPKAATAFGVDTKRASVSEPSELHKDERLREYPFFHRRLKKLRTGKRTRLNEDAKKIIITAAESASDKKEVISELSKKRGHDKATDQSITHWQAPNKMGRPCNKNFRQDVLDQLIYTQVEDAYSPEKLVVVANVTKT
ncbi:MAG: hypothetical protein SGPRY_010434 [Prymnesium sp.]